MLSCGNTKEEGKESRRDFVKRKLKQVGKTQVELAQALGIAGPRLSEKLRSDDKDTFSPAELGIIADFLKIPLVKAIGKLTTLDRFDDEEFIYLPILGEAREGRWCKSMLQPADTSDYIIIERGEEPKPHSLYGLRITCDSMSKYYPPYRTVVACLPYAEAKKEDIRSGAHVVVCRSGPEDQCELTIKELLVKDGEIFLLPKSADDSHATYQITRKDNNPSYYGTKDLKIIGVVVRAVVDQVAPPAKANAEALP